MRIPLSYLVLTLALAACSEAAEPRRGAEQTPEPSTTPPATPPSPPPVPVASSGSCVETAPPASTLFAALEQADRDRFGEARPIVLTAELDGAPPLEAVLAADTHERESESAEGDELYGAIWVFRCADGAFTLLAAKKDYVVGRGWDGIIDGEPGFKVVRAERVLSTVQDALRVEWRDQYGGSAPFTETRTFQLLALRDGQLASVFDCPTHYLEMRGPERFGRSWSRTIVFLRETLPARIRVHMRSSWDSGVVDEEEEEIEPDDDLPASFSESGVYVFDGTRYGSRSRVCGEPER